MKDSLTMLQESYKFYIKSLEYNRTFLEKIQEANISLNEKRLNMLNIELSVVNNNTKSRLSTLNDFTIRRYKINEFLIEYSRFVNIFRFHFEYNNFYPISKQLTDFNVANLANQLFGTKLDSEGYYESNQNYTYSTQKQASDYITKKDKLCYAFFTSLCKIEYNVNTTYLNMDITEILKLSKLIPKLAEINSRLLYISNNQKKEDWLYVIFQKDWENLYSLMEGMEN